MGYFETNFGFPKFLTRTFKTEQLYTLSENICISKPLWFVISLLLKYNL